LLTRRMQPAFPLLEGWPAGRVALYGWGDVVVADGAM
jgi:hypothetical protein